MTEAAQPITLPPGYNWTRIAGDDRGREAWIAHAPNFDGFHSWLWTVTGPGAWRADSQEAVWSPARSEEMAREQALKMLQGPSQNEDPGSAA